MKFDRRTFLRSVSAASVLGGAGTVAAAGTYTNHYYGGFDYWKYVPDSAGANAPLVVMLHGCSQGADQFRTETRMNWVADREGFVVIYPDQYNARNGAQCWNWFYDSNTTRGNGEAAVIAGMTRETVSAESVDPRRVYLAGPPRARRWCRTCSRSTPTSTRRAASTPDWSTTPQTPRPAERRR